MEIKDLKVGDRLKRKSIGNDTYVNHILVNVGDIVTITNVYKIDNDEWAFDITTNKSDFGKSSYEYTYFERYWELLPREEISTVYPTIYKVESLNTKENEVKMELKDMKPENLAEAMKQYTEEKKNAEIIEAKSKLTVAKDKLLELDRQIKVLEEQKKPYQEVVDAFIPKTN